MKRVILILVMVCLISFVFAAKPKLNIYIWSDYISDEIFDQFEEEYNCKVVLDTYDSNESMYAKLKAGRVNYDIVFPSGNFVSVMIKEDMLKEVDKSRLSNYSNLAAGVLDMAVYDTGLKYSVPFMMDATGIGVNKAYLKDYPRSWRIFELPEIKGRSTLMDNMREVFGAALKTLGYSANSTNRKELEEAKSLIEKWQKNIAKFDNELFAKGIISGEFFVVHGYGENIFFDATEEEVKDIEFFIPEEGGVFSIDSMVMLKWSKNEDLAYDFINFILRPEIAAAISSNLLLPSPNVPASKLVEVEPMYTFDELIDCEMVLDIGEAIRIYSELWNEIRFGL